MRGALRVLASSWAGAAELGSKQGAKMVAEAATRSFAAAAAPALSVSGVSGDAAGVLSAVEALVARDGPAGPQDVSDAAVALAYLGARGNRRLWGQVLEKAAAVGPSLDGPALANLSWALSAANVNHGRTVAELAGPAAAALKKLSPSQLSYIVEALGKSGAADVELFSAVADVAEARAAELKSADWARLLWGFGAAGVQDPKLIKSASAALAKAGDLGGREAAQALWGLAALGRVPEAGLASALGKALKAGVEAPADAAAAAWALATLGVRPDSGVAKALGDKAKAGAADLSAAQAAQGGWGLASLGDKDGATALLGAAAAAVAKDPTALSPSGLALLHAGAVAAGGAGLPAAVADFAAKGFGLAVEHARHVRGSAAAAFHAELAEAVAYASGARHRPDVAAKVASFSSAAPDGSSLDIVVPLDGAAKLAIIGVEAELLGSGGAVLGGSQAVARVREAQGYKVVLVPQGGDWPSGGAVKARAQAVLAAVKKAGLGAVADKLAKEL
ncbi:hypothetical protein GPECTOR_55g295 [Gonium pectorale]|uniref:RAP domain-containing protein n=1 Tax=Gonium pectorale TaxID=33097 RepID=A0A150G688_GONPE|nr:hypothetical protein GPECTOR_55g295 [Gonium pectorale]|eukprot:KXZ45389.1 hypothetical protein GPECTOR_55g295 [Gonium pectorale]